MTITNNSPWRPHRKAGAHSGAEPDYTVGKTPAGDSGQVSMAMNDVESVDVNATHIITCVLP